MRRYRLRVLGLLLAAIVGSFGAYQPPARAADVVVELKVVPEEISLEPGRAQQTIVVTAKTTPASSFALAELKPVPSEGIKVATIPQTAPIAQNSDLAWTVTIAADARAGAASTVVFLLNYRLAGGTPGEGMRVATATAKVSYAYLPLSGSVTVALQKGFDVLEPGKTGRAVLVIQNSGAEAVLLKNITATAPDFVDIDWDIKTGEILARDKVAVPIGITPKDRIPQGAAPILLNLEFSRTPTGPTESVVVADTINASVPGLSEITTLLQVPSLLLLPGLLVLLTWNLLCRMFGNADFKLSPTDGEFYAVSITLSLIIAAAYTWYIGEHFDFLRRVAVSDIAYLWGWSIIVGIAGFVAFFAGRGVYQANRARKQKAEWERTRLEKVNLERKAKEEWLRKNPQPEDDAETILRKLAENVKTLSRETFILGKPGQKRQRVFKLGFGDTGEAGQSWVVPKINIDAAGAASSVRPRIDALIDNDDAPALVEYLGAEGRDCSVGWEPGDLIAKPVLLANADLTDPQGQQSIAGRK